MHVYVLGAGIMGSQIAVEYALGGHQVTVAVRDPARARGRLEVAVALAAEHGLADLERLGVAGQEVAVVGIADPVPGDIELVVESVEER